MLQEAAVSSSCMHFAIRIVSCSVWCVTQFALISLAPCGGFLRFAPCYGVKSRRLKLIDTCAASSSRSCSVFLAFLVAVLRHASILVGYHDKGGVS